MAIKDSACIEHIIEAATEAISFLGDKSLEDLYTDRKLVLALMKEIEIVGEAASKLSKRLKAINPHIPWIQIVGMRNRLIHVYFDIDFEAIWNTVKYDLPPLLEEMKKINAEN